MDIADQQSLDPDQLVLRPSRGKWVLVFAGSTAFVLAGLWMVRVGGPMPRVPFGDARLWGWIGILFFGLGVPMSLAQLLGSHFNLTLTPDAFTFGTLRGKQTYRWSDVTSFSPRVIADRPWPFRPIGMVRFEFTPAVSERLSAGFWVRKLGGSSGGLLDSYGMSAESLAAKMNHWKRRYAR